MPRVSEHIRHHQHDRRQPQYRLVRPHNSALSGTTTLHTLLQDPTPTHVRSCSPCVQQELGRLPQTATLIWLHCHLRHGQTRDGHRRPTGGMEIGVSQPCFSDLVCMLLNALVIQPRSVALPPAWNVCAFVEISNSSELFCCAPTAQNDRISPNATSSR